MPHLARAAERLGFRFEGIFRQATVYKGRNRDTAWYSIIDAEWPTLEAEFGRWLDPDNFHGDGSQRSQLVMPRSSGFSRRRGCSAWVVRVIASTARITAAAV